MLELFTTYLLCNTGTYGSCAFLSYGSEVQWVLELFTTCLLCDTGTYCSRAFLSYEKVERQ